MAIVYRHRRLDNNKVFYIGIGNKEYRAYRRSGRNNLWTKIADKSGYTVEIIYNDISIEDARELEEFLISEYGRKDLGLGELANLTNGGELNKGVIFSEEKKQHLRKVMKGMKYPNRRKKCKEDIDKLREYTTGSKSGKSKLVLNTQTGIYYDCVREAAQSLDMNKVSLSCMLRGIYKNKTYLIYV